MNVRILSVFAATIYIVATSIALSATISVPGAFSTIQLAIDDAATTDGDIIQVTDSGVYAATIVTKSVTIESVPAGATISSTGNALTISGGGDNVTIKDFYIYCTDDGSAVNVTDPPADSSTEALTLENCVIQSAGANVDGDESGIFVNTGAGDYNIALTGCTIDGNTRRGLTINAGTGTVTAVNTSISNNGETGIISWVDHDIILNNCTVDNNGQGGFGRGIEFTNGTVTMTGGSISGNNNQALLPDWGGRRTADLTGVTIDGNGEQQVALFAPGDYTFTNCSIINGTQYEALVRYFNWDATPSTVLIDNCLIEGNNSTGVRMDGQLVNLTMRDTVIQSNVNFSMELIGVDAINLDADRCTFVQNGSADFNVILKTPGTSTLTNCVIDDGGTNPSWGGNMLLETGTINLEHCTIVSGQSAAVGLEINVGSTVVNATNCIIAGQVTAVDSNAGDGSTYNGDYNLVTATTNFAGNATAGANTIENGNPMFTTASTGPGSGDFHLLNDSDAVGAGLEIGVVDDRDGGSRPLPAATAPDMGAYESVAVPVTISVFQLD